MTLLFISYSANASYSYDDALEIISDDGAVLQANIMLPDDIDETAPAVILIHGFAGSEHHNETQAAHLTDEGYIVLRYTARGFHDSDGMINFAGPEDMADFSAVIDYLLEHYPVDENSIGAGGSSYGCMISTLGAAHDPRIKAVAALSCTMDTLESLYGNNTNLSVFGLGMELGGYLTGKADPYGIELLYAMRFNQTDRLLEIQDWAYVRSPINYVDALNANGTAMYVVKEWDDYLFKTNRALDMFELLSGPKHMEVLQGFHASSSRLSAIPWDTAYDWFDMHLKGKDTALNGAPNFNIEVELTGERESYNSYPLDVNTETFYLHPRGLLGYGKLKSGQYLRPRWFDFLFGPVDNTINSAVGSLFTTGIPAIGVVGGVELGNFELYLIPRTNMALSSKANSIYFRTGLLGDKMEIRGIPSVSLNIQPFSDNVQVVGYLYDVDLFGNAKLVTHGVSTLLNTAWGETITMDFDFVATAYDVPAGNRLAVAFDTQDNLQYLRPEYTARFLDFEFSNSQQSWLSLPTLK